jgi:hypothetical protein
MVPGGLPFAAAAVWRLVTFGPEPDLLGAWWPSVAIHLHVLPARDYVQVDRPLEVVSSRAGQPAVPR